jgi:glycosyltransferase involved in cell wall biosynthesis
VKILFAIKAINEVEGGAERVIADVSSGLAERGHDVSLLSFDSPGGCSFYPLNSAIRRLCLGIGSPLQKATVKETVKRTLALRWTVKKEQPDVVVAFMHSMFVPMAFALIGTGIPVVASEHTVPQYYQARRFEYFLLLISTLLVRRITVLSKNVILRYPKIFRKRLVVISNPVHEQTVSADPVGKERRRRTILSVGRLDPLKDQKTLIEAFARLASSHPDWDVRIIGNGPLRGELEEMIQQYQLQGRVFLPGTTPEIMKEYQQAQIFALPSLYESFGLATAEAMSLGLPPLGFVDCQGTNELIVNGENGMLVGGDDRVGDFTQGLEKLINSPELRVKYGTKAKQIIDRFNPDKIIASWEQLIEEVVQKS